LRDFITLIKFDKDRIVYIQKENKRYNLIFSNIQNGKVIPTKTVSLDQFIRDISLFEK